MLRKINNPEYIIPYVVGSKPKKQIKKYRMTMIRNQNDKYYVPREWREKLMTRQRPFGKSIEELNEEDYKKYQ